MLQVTEKCWCGCFNSFWEPKYNTPASIVRVARRYFDRPWRPYRHRSRRPVRSGNRPCPRRLEPVPYRFVILTSTCLHEGRSLRPLWKSAFQREHPVSPVQGTLPRLRPLCSSEEKPGGPVTAACMDGPFAWRGPVTGYPFGPCCQSYPNDPMRPNSGAMNQPNCVRRPVVELIFTTAIFRRQEEIYMTDDFFLSAGTGAHERIRTSIFIQLPFS